MAIFGAGPPFELSLDLFRVLMVFSEATTPRHAFNILDVDVDIEHFTRIIANFIERGLLRCVDRIEDGKGLRHFLNPSVFSDPAVVDKIGYQLRLGRAVVISEALPPDLAERVHQDLERSTSWTPTEGAHDFFHHRNCMIEATEEHSPSLLECSRLFRSTATRQFIGELTGEDCTGEAGVSATWYRSGEYALPHNDSETAVPRSVAYIWYLTKNWRPECSASSE